MPLLVSEGGPATGACSQPPGGPTGVVRLRSEQRRSAAKAAIEPTPHDRVVVAIPIVSSSALRQAKQSWRRRDRRLLEDAAAQILPVRESAKAWSRDSTP